MDSLYDKLQIFSIAIEMIMSFRYFSSNFTRHQCENQKKCYFNKIIKQQEDKSDLALRNLFNGLILNKANIDILSLGDFLSLIIKKILEGESYEMIQNIHLGSCLKIIEIIECGCRGQKEIPWRNETFIFPVYMPQDLSHSCILSDIINDQCNVSLNICPIKKICSVKFSTKQIHLLSSPQILIFELFWTITDLSFTRKFLKSLSVE